MDLAKDMVQDAFEVLWNNRETIQVEKAKQYLFTVVYRKGIDIFRKEKNNVQMSEDFDRGVMDSHEALYSDRELIRKAVDKLPELHRRLVLLRDLEGYDYKEIGEITDLNESQVKVYLFRARKMLKETITKLEAI
jgi:RNA polymerase sigma factor (sigma-70 family)